MWGLEFGVEIAEVEAVDIAWLFHSQRQFDWRPSIYHICCCSNVNTALPLEALTCCFSVTLTAPRECSAAEAALPRSAELVEFRV